MGLGVGMIIVGSIAVAAGAGLAYASVSRQGRSNQDMMQPNSLDDFDITYAREDQKIPLLYGRCKVPPNVLNYGGLSTTPIYTKSGGGKGGGGGSKKSVTGYQYRINVWYGLCMANNGSEVELIATFMNGDEKTPSASTTYFNNGVNGLYPTWLDGASPLPGLAHMSYRSLYIGDNVSTLPPMEYILERKLDTSVIPNANLPNGANPAAVIWDMYMQAGRRADRLYLPSFRETADYYEDKGYGLNFLVNSKSTLQAQVQKVADWVDLLVYENSDGLIAIRPLSADDSVVATYSTDNMKGLSIRAISWEQVPNSFVGTYIDQDQQYSKRTVRVPNAAGIAMRGVDPETIDLTCFRDRTTTAKRLSEIAKRDSYPAKKLQFVDNLRSSLRLPGDVIQIQKLFLGINSADYRITDIDLGEIDDNKVTIKAHEMVETIHDDSYVDLPGTEYSTQGLNPIPLTHIELVELPYNSLTEFESAWLILAAREHGTETAFIAMVSDQEDQDFETFGEYEYFSMRGTLDLEYSNDTFAIDDEVGIRFTPYKQDPVFDSVSRSGLFTQSRMAIIGDEFIQFQTVTPQQDGSILLTGCVRGVYNTPVQTHQAGATIWLAYIGSNILKKVHFDDFYVRILPRIENELLDEGEATSIAVSRTYRARQPYSPGRLVATRTGNQIDVQIYPRTPGIDGAGTQTPSHTDSPPPFPFEGDFWVEWGAQSQQVTSDTFSITQAGEVTVNVASRLNGFTSSNTSVVVGADNGTYYG